MESELSADKKVEQLSEEELHCVLKQLTDHNIPEREKCPLVQRLNAEDALASNNTSYSSLLPQTSARSSNHSSVKLRSRLHVLSNENELEERSLTQPNHTPQSHSQSHCRDKPVNYAQTLQELRTNNNCDDSQNLPAAISNRNTEIVATASHLRSGGSNRKPNRANSFTMPSQSDNNSNKSDSTFKILDHHLTNGTEVSRESLTVGDKQTLNGSSSMSNYKSSSSAINSCAPQSCSNSSHYLLSETDHNHSSYKSTSSNYSSVHLNNIETLVNRIPLTSDTVSSNFPRLNSERGALNKSKQLTVQEEDEERPQFCEMKDLHSNFDIVQYSDLNLSLKDQQNSNSEKHNVDKTLDMPMLTMNNNNEENLYHYQNPNNLHQYGNFVNNPNTTTTNGNRGTKKKKRLPDVVRKSEHVEGYVGYIQDVDYLESFVNNTSSSNNGSMNNFDKKNKGKTQKLENEIGKRTKRNNGEIKLNNDGDKGVLSTKLALSNSSSLSGDETSGVKNGVLAKPNTSPEVFNSNGTKSKKGKSKNKQDKNKANNERENFSLDKVDSNKHRKDDSDCLRDEANGNSSSNASDSEEDQSMEYYPRSKKSNSLLPTQTVILPEDDNLHTVSDSEMADREKGFVTPKNKYFKKKKIQQSRFQPHESAHISSQKQSSSKNLPYNSNTVGVHNLGRGYESEREYSLNNCINPNSFTSQSLSSSMLAINSRVSDKRLLSNLSPPTKEESPPILSESTDLDKEFMLAASDTYDCGPKIPSYADIAKSYYHPPNITKSVTTCMKQPSSDNSSTIEDFPQLDSRSPIEPAIDFLNGNSKINISTLENLTFKPVSTSKIDSPNKEDSCRKEKVSTPNATSIIQEESEMNDKSDSANISTLSDIQINHQNDFESPTKSDIPVIIYGKEDNSNLDMKSTFNCDQLTENFINGTLSFGFFDESEISMFREAEFSPLDQNFYNSQLNSDMQTKNFENIEINGHIDLDSINEIQMCENANFYKNAVHVNVLEKQYFRKLDDQGDCVRLQSENNKAAYSSSTSSPLSSSFDSSPASSAAVSSSSVLSNSNSANQPKSDKPFVSCVSTLSNLKFIDNVDLCSFNYKKVIQYVYDSWEQFKSL